MSVRGPAVGGRLSTKHQRKAGHQSQEHRRERHYHYVLVMHLFPPSAFFRAEQRCPKGRHMQSMLVGMQPSPSRNH